MIIRACLAEMVHMEMAFLVIIATLIFVSCAPVQIHVINAIIHLFLLCLGILANHATLECILMDTSALRALIQHVLIVILRIVINVIM